MPVTATGEDVTDELSAGLVTVSGVVPCVGDVAACVARQDDVAVGGDAASRTNDAADHVSGEAEPPRRR